MQLKSSRHTYTVDIDADTAAAEAPAQTLPAIAALTTSERIRPTEACITVDGTGALVGLELTGPYQRPGGGDGPVRGVALYDDSTAHRQAAPVVQRLTQLITAALLDGGRPAELKL